ncbi:MAG: hypothetical protein R2940_15710 [Syntrophotaleaceae bacterium]
MRFRIGWIFCFSLLFLLAGCDYLPFGFTPIGEIVRNPGSFEGKTIKVRGEVTDVTQIPFLELKGYVLRDDSGEILVFTMETLPPLHEKTAIKAQVKTMAIINQQSFGLRLVEIERLPTFGFSKKAEK